MTDQAESGPEFLETDVVVFLHDQLLREYGGAHGVQKDDLLQSALSRPVNRLAYSEAGTVDLFDIAAAYAYGLVKNHAFTDANKRTAWAVCALFLKVNGADFSAPTADIIETVVRLAAGNIDEAGFAAWLRSRSIA